MRPKPVKNPYGIHVKCEESWSAKCRNEAMARFAVLREWPTIICVDWPAGA